MENWKSIRRQNLGFYFRVLGEWEDRLVTTLFEEVETYLASRQVWKWNSFEDVLALLNSWLIQYNKTLSAPVFVAVAATYRSHQRNFFALSDSFLGVVPREEGLLWLGHHVADGNSFRPNGTEEVFIPRHILGASERPPSHLVNESFGVPPLIFPVGVDVLAIEALYRDAGYDMETFCSLLTDSNIPFLGQGR